MIFLSQRLSARGHPEAIPTYLENTNLVKTKIWKFGLTHQELKKNRYFVCFVETTSSIQRQLALNCYLKIIVSQDIPKTPFFSKMPKYGTRTRSKHLKFIN